MKVIKYGIEKKYSLKIFNEYGIHEHYLSYMKLGKHKLPFFGGGYFRLLPYPITKSLSNKLNAKRAVFYMHPYEIDTGELAAVKKLHGDIPLKWRLSQFGGRDSVESKLHKLMSDYSFTSFEREYYSDYSQSTPPNPLTRDSKITTSNIKHSKIVTQLEHS